MSHVYASVDELKKEIVDGGTSYGTINDASLLTVLESASARVERYCDRSQFGSGFGPRLGTNRYDSWRIDGIDLMDDVLTVTSVTALNWTLGSPTSLTEDTDYFLTPYGRTQKRKIQTTYTANVLTYGFRVLSVVGTMGYQNVTAPSTTTVASGLSVGTTATTFTTSASPTISPGQTLLIGTEQVYVSGLSGTTATIVRAANGTTAATHADASTIAVYQYPSEVKDATLRVALRRWKARDAGLTGDFGGGQLPTTMAHDTEGSILNATVGHLRLLHV